MRSDGTRAEKALGGCAIAVGSLLLMVLVAYLAPEDDPFSFSLLRSVLRFFALFFLFVAVWAAAAGLRGLIVAPARTTCTKAESSTRQGNGCSLRRGRKSAT